MMTKWDTIQADVADAYVYLEEEEAYNKALAEGLDLRLSQYDEDEMSSSTIFVPDEFLLLAPSVASCIVSLRINSDC